MFGQVLDKLDTYFGRAFLLARYVPWLLFAAANLVLACLEFPAVRAFAAEAYAAPAGRVFDLVVAMLAIWVIAYATSPLAQFVTRFLEGATMWKWVAHLTIVTHALRRDELEREYRRDFALSAALPQSSAVIAALRADRAEGARHRKIGNRRAIDAAEKNIERLRAERWFNRVISPERFESARRALSKALQENCADAGLFLEVGDKYQASRLHELHDEMVRRLAPYALDRAEQIEEKALAERERLFGERELAPTRLGNDAAALRSYCLTRYGIEFDFFWPRFLLVVQKDAKLSDSLAMAKIQLDFSILTLTLTMATVVGWSVFLLFEGRSLWTALAVIGLGPPVAYGWLGIVHASYSGFAETVRSAIDLHRFELLAALRHPLPASTDEEKDAWAAVSRLSILNSHKTTVVFKHPAP